MRNALVAIAFSLLSTGSFAASIDPATTNLKWMNGPARDSTYKFGDHTDKVHVLEAWSLGCTWCNQNAVQVEAMATEYASDTQVQFIDLGLDSSDSSYTQWIQRHSPSYPVVKDDGSVWNALHQDDGIPQTFVIDCHGHLVDYTVGFWGDAEKATIKSAIATAKQTSCN